MLGRLIKHELKATSRILIPAVLVWFGIAVFQKIALMMSHTGEELFLVISSVIFFLATMAVSIIMLVIIILRLYKSQLGDQGYLTFTLPVRTESIVLSKVIMAAIWQIVLVLLSILCMFMMLNNDAIEILKSDILPYFTFINVPFIVMVVGHAIVSSVFEVMIIYSAIAIASLFNKHRLLLSFAFYLAIEFVVQTLNFIAGFIVGNSTENAALSMIDKMEISEEMTTSQILEVLNSIFSEVFSPMSVLPFIGLMLIISAVLFFVISRIFKKHLNLK